MGISDAVSPVQKVGTSEMSVEMADHFGIVEWGAPGAEAGNKIAVELQLKNALGQTLAKVERIRLTCTTGATMALKAAGKGVVLSGGGSDDMIIETDVATGTFDLEVATANVGVITVVGGATQGSGFVACEDSVDLTFA